MRKHSLECSSTCNEIPVDVTTQTEYPIQVTIHIEHAHKCAILNNDGIQLFV